MTINYLDIFGQELTKEDIKRSVSFYKNSTTLNDTKRHIYRLSFQLEGISQRIYKIGLLLFKTLFSLGTALFFSSFRSQWLCCLQNKSFIDLTLSDDAEMPVSLLESASFKNVTFRQVISVVRKFSTPYCFPSSLSLGFNELNSIKLKTFPLYILEFTKISYLKLCGHQLDSLPENFSKMTELENIDFSGNQFEAIPECIYTLSHDCTVNFEDNPLTKETLQAIKEKTSSLDYVGPKIKLPAIKFSEESYKEDSFADTPK